MKRIVIATRAFVRFPTFTNERATSEAVSSATAIAIVSRVPDLSLGCMVVRVLVRLSNDSLMVANNPPPPPEPLLSPDMNDLILRRTPPKRSWLMIVPTLLRSPLLMPLTIALASLENSAPTF